MAFCLCIDLDGFQVGGEFLVRELGWCAPLTANREVYGVHHFTHHYTWDKLTVRDAKKAAYVKRHVTGLSLRPSPMEYSYGAVLQQEDLPLMVLKLWRQYRTSECDIVAYKGGTLEKHLLTLLNIPSLDLEKKKCPKFKQLYLESSSSSFPKCPCHTHSTEFDVHCAMSECYAFTKWYSSNKVSFE